MTKNDIDLKTICSDILDINFNSEQADDNDVGWIYTLHCLKVLASLIASLRSTSIAFVGFSVIQQKEIMNCLQFVVGLGMSPNMLPGIGIPMDERITFSLFLKVLEKHSNQWIKYERLAVCAEKIIQLCEDKHLSSIIISKYLADVIAALCQLCFAPLKKVCKVFLVSIYYG